MVEAAQVAGEVVSRSRVGLCDRAARQWKVTPGMRLHVPTVPLCASPVVMLFHHDVRQGVGFKSSRILFGLCVFFKIILG